MRRALLLMLLAVAWPTAVSANGALARRIADGAHAKILRERGKRCLVRVGSERGWVRCSLVKKGGGKRSARAGRKPKAGAVATELALGDLVVANVDFTARRQPRLDSLNAFDVPANALLLVQEVDERGRWARVSNGESVGGWMPVLYLTKQEPERNAVEVERRAEEGGDGEEE